MRITSIELAGSIEKGKRLPRAFARIGRKLGSESIDVTILLPGGEETQHLDAGREDDIRSMARRLQRLLDGYHGTPSEIEDYCRELQRFAD